MIKRIRDKIRQFKPQEVVAYKDWLDIVDRYNYAFDFMKETNPAYAIMREDLKDAESIVLENRVHEVKEVHIISDVFQKIFTTEKKVQVDELVGQIKYLRGYFAELQSWIDRKVRLEKLEADGKIIIRREEREDKHEGR
jgi:hypothetical protein